MNHPIIIIDDDPDDREILKDVLAELDIKNSIISFDDCQMAYNYLMSMNDKPFLIICDINLPKMNGIELKKKIDATDYLRKKAIPFVFLSTSDTPATVNEAYSVTNLQGFFKKSTTIEELKSKVKLVMEYWQESLHPNSHDQSWVLC